jgi:non-heme chloroperoxidase
MKGCVAMDRFTTKDGTSIYFKDWGSGPPVVFSHGWPLSADAWEDQMIFLADRGFRCIAHDRQTWGGNDMDTFVSDLDELMTALGITGATHVGHSTGGGEAARYVAQRAKGRAIGLVMISAVPPIMLKSDANPGGLPMSVFDDIRKSITTDRAQFWKDLSAPFFGANRPGAKVSQGLRDFFWLQGMMSSIKADYDCVKAFSETDFTEDLKKIDIPVLVMHGDDDQIVPIVAAGPLSAKILKKATLKVYPGFPHGMPTTNADRINADLLAFLQQTHTASA